MSASRLQNNTLRDRVVVITGAARGIGEALTRAFLARGARVAAMDLRWDAGSELLGALKGSESLPLTADITQDDQVRNAFEQTLAAFGRVDVLINNAAMRQRDFYPVSGACAVLDTTDEQWDRMYRINTIGTLKVIRAFIRPMRERKSGHIINVSANGSLTREIEPGVHIGNHPHLLNQPYEASKASLNSLAYYLAEEVRAENISVNTVYPGATLTTGSTDLVKGRTALGIAAPLSPPEHVVPVCLYLAGQPDAGVTGKGFDILPWNAANPDAARL